MFFLKLLHFSILLTFLFYSNTFCDCCGNNQVELEKKQLDKYIGLDEVQVMSINQPSCYFLCKENPETKIGDVSIEILTQIYDKNGYNEVEKSFKLGIKEDCLDRLRITKVSEGYYILSVYDEKNKKVFYLNRDIEEYVLLLSDKNILGIEKLNEGIKEFNECKYVDFILKIKSIKGLKIYKDAIKLEIK